ncbi:MAG: hypothetical protein FJW30_02460 [Acidobacteria bacterium]|nr:hypothetical protein [Acidobacteriota bacterium]
MLGEIREVRPEFARSALSACAHLPVDGPEGGRGPHVRPRKGHRRQGAIRAVGFILGAAALASPCATCHAGKAAAQSRSRHAKALRPYDGAGFAGKTLRERGGTEYRYSASGVTITRDGESREAAIQWLFGAGHFAATPLLRIDGEWIEHRVSRYTAGDRLSLTPGHSRQPADSIATALGIVQTKENERRCFGCHMTSGRPGVHCESCHGAGDSHPAAAASIRRDRSVALCATCHRAPNERHASSTPELDDTASIRFAPVGLQASRCFLMSGGRLTCVTCHDPHTDLADSKTYDAACRACHAPKQNCRPDCASCHMPKSSPMPFLTFTDHRIRR